MKKGAIFLLFLAGITLFTGCRRSQDEFCDDARTCGRHMNRGMRSLGGKHGDSRAVTDRNDFYPGQKGFSGAPMGGDFVPLPDFECPDDIAFADFVAPQPRETPGDPGSSIPGIDSFKDPTTVPELRGVFKTIHFEYNSNLVKGEDNLRTVDGIAYYMKNHPNTYIFVEGHCDERGPEAYNLSLGARRSNAVRNLLITEGVDPDRIFTISYGKERPLLLEHHEEAWSQNRRADFKVYVK